MHKTPQVIAAGKFKAQCLALLDRVGRTREPLVVTKHGRPVAKIVPADPPRAPSLRGSVTILGDIVGPLGEVWEADQ